MKIRRFVLFTFNQFYPAGGWGDQIGSYATLAEARAAAEKNFDEYKEIVDLQTGKRSWIYRPKGESCHERSKT